MIKHMSKNNFLDLNYQRTKLSRFLNSLKSSDADYCFKALSWAEQGHIKQRRDSDIPYVIHPIRVALTLPEKLGITEADMICAALMHDLVEDSGYTIEHIENEFGSEVARLVKGLTRKRPKGETEEQKRINKPLKFKEIAEADEKIRLLKLCDILDNMQSMKYIPRDNDHYKKIPRWKKELKEYVLPIAKNTNETLYNLLSSFV
jgi:(p)ppGpp synthase/HD superfamily hydrolase